MYIIFYQNCSIVHTLNKFQGVPVKAGYSGPQWGGIPPKLPPLYPSAHPEKEACSLLWIHY